MLHTLISNPIIHTVPRRYFTVSQGNYISRIASYSYGTYGTLCSATNKLKHSETSRYDFLETIEFMFKNFLCNQVEREVFYHTSFEAWDDFLSHLPDVPEDKELSFNFVQHNSLSSDDESSVIYSMVCTAHEKGSDPVRMIDDVHSGEHQVFNYQISEHQAKKLDQINMNIDYDDFKSLCKNSDLQVPFH